MTKLCVLLLFVLLVNCVIGTVLADGSDYASDGRKSERLLLDEGNGRKLEHERQILMEINKQLQDQQDAARKALEELVRIDAIKEMKEKAEIEKRKKSSRLRNYVFIEQFRRI